MSTALALYDATAILSDLMKTHDASLCDVCSAKLVANETYSICRFPDAPASTRGLPEEHLGHTACKTCADDPCLYIGDGGACKPCLRALGGRRSSVKLAGVALRPPVKNGMADLMLKGFQEAQTTIDDVREQHERERLQDQDDRRAAAVEDKRRRRAEAEEEARALEEARRLRAEAEEAALAAEERRREADADAERIVRQADADAQERRRLATDGGAPAAPVSPDSQQAATKKKRKANTEVDEETARRRKEQARIVYQEKKAMVDDYPRLYSALETAKRTLEDVVAIAKSELAAAGVSTASFDARLEAVVAKDDDDAEEAHSGDVLQATSE
jgi:hypothetical protein